MKVGATGKLKAGAYWIGTKAHDRDDRVVYDSKTGYLDYDYDGSRSGKAVAFAKLKPGLKMSSAGFYVV